MNQKALSFFFENYDFKNFKSAGADQGFIENHLTSQYAADEQQVMRTVRRAIADVSVHPEVRTDFMFDAGGYEGFWRRKEAYRVCLSHKLVMKAEIHMGEEDGTYDIAPAALAKLQSVGEANLGKRFVASVDNEPGQPSTVDLDYAFLFNQVRNLMSQLSDRCVFKVENAVAGLSVTFMPLTAGLAQYAEETNAGKQDAEGTGTYIKIQLRNVD